MNSTFRFYYNNQALVVDSESVKSLSLPQLVALSEAASNAIVKYCDKPNPDKGSARLAQWASHWRIIAISLINQYFLDQQQQLLSNISSISDSIDDLSSRLHSINHSRSVVDALW